MDRGRKKGREGRKEGGGRSLFDFKQVSLSFSPHPHSNLYNGKVYKCPNILIELVLYDVGPSYYLFSCTMQSYILTVRRQSQYTQRCHSLFPGCDFSP